MIKVTSLLEMANTCIKKDPEAAALYYDELSSVVGTGNLDSRVVVRFVLRADLNSLIVFVLTVHASSNPCSLYTIVCDNQKHMHCTYALIPEYLNFPLPSSTTMYLIRTTPLQRTTLLLLPTPSSSLCKYYLSGPYSC